MKTIADKQRDQLKRLCNQVASEWSMKRLKTWDDAYKIVGRPLEGAKSGTINNYVEVKEFIAGLKAALEEKINKPAAVVKEAVANIAPSVPSILVPVAVPVLTAVPEPPKPEPEFNTSDYGLPANSACFSLFWFQKKAVKEILDKLLGFDVATCPTVAELKAKWHSLIAVLPEHEQRNVVKSGVAVLAATGTGKTFIVAATIRYLVDIGWADDKTFGSTKYLNVTRASIVEQTKRVFLKFGLSLRDGVEVLNIEQLRSRAGAVWIKTDQVIVNGQEQTVVKWKAPIAPAFIAWDECQALKNEGTQQHNIAAAYNDVPGTAQLFVSATPFTRVSEAKCFAVSTRKPISDFLDLGYATILTNGNWKTYAQSIAGDRSRPEEYNEAAIERLRKDLDPWIVQVRGVRPQFDAVNKIRMIRFETAEERDEYNRAWEEYLEEKAKLEKAGLEEGHGGMNPRFEILVRLQRFCMKAEKLRANYLAREMFESVQKDGKAAVCAVKFKGTIISIMKILHDKYGVSRDLVSLIWGGGQTDLSKKQKQKKKIMDKVDALREAGIDVDELLAQLELDNIEERELEHLPEHLKLGSQSKEDRQNEIDRFQSGRSLYCMYTFRAGGVGLSLHHTDEFTKQKCRRQKNGYVYTEDIPSIPIRPRRTFVAPTYSAMEMVQGLGRTPRLTSLSDSEQFLVFYSGTVEVEVAKTVSQKLKCLSRVVRQRETWQDVVLGGVKKEAFRELSEVDMNANAPAEGTDYDSLNDNDEEDEE